MRIRKSEYWREAFPDDVILIQVGAFYEHLQWPVRRNDEQSGNKQGVAGLRRMRSNRRGAVEGFPLHQLRRRVAAWLAAGQSVLVVAQSHTAGGRLLQRRPKARWRATSTKLCGALKCATACSLMSSWATNSNSIS